MEKGRIKIAGNGTIQSGTYEEIKVMGNASAKGNIVADRIKIMGETKFEGDVESNECTILGRCEITGNIKVGRLKVNGECIINGICEAEELIVNGSSNVSGEVICKHVVVRGRLKLNEDCRSNSIKVYGQMMTSCNISCEEITIEGKFDCKELLNAEKVYVHTTTHSYCKEIGATYVEVLKPIYHFLWLSYHKKNTFTCELIEADEMKLENVVAKVVRGKSIELVHNCDINTIEYSEVYREGDNCMVKEATKID